MRPTASSLRNERGDLYVAGIGASAGGIEAMLKMFSALQATGRISYIVAQHMAHDAHSDLVARLLGRESALPVMLASDGEQLQADTVYVIPAGKDGYVRAGLLALQQRGAGNFSSPSVNTLFSSISQSCGAQGIGIVLSGTGADGMVGCQAIKHGGGLTIAQLPDEAKFDGMPTAAIDARVIDQVLPVEMIGKTLAALFPGLPCVASSSAVAAAMPVADELLPLVNTPELVELEALLRLVRQATGIDFSGYKEETLLRRLEKRKEVLGMSSAEDYRTFIKNQPDELKILQEIFLVSVSSFFRDPASFRELQRALSTMVEHKAPGEPIRVWVPGCASGDECYSLAIVFSELLGDGRANHPVRILGSDLNPDALAIARSGIFRPAALRDVDDLLRQRYFTEHGLNFEVAASLREMVSFEQRDVLNGDSLLALDLVSCRNLLIYMKSALQDQLIKRFHQALRPQGLLFVGQSESLSFLGNSLFSPVDRYHRLFRRRH